MREKRRRIRRALTLAFVLLSLGAGAAVWVAYAYVTDSDTWTSTIRAEAPKFFPGSTVDVVRVQPGLLSGRLSLKNINLTQTIDNAPFVAATILGIEITHDPHALLKGKFVPSRVDVSFPVLRLKRRADGRWNLQGLLADPWPLPDLDSPPPIYVRNGTIELSDESGTTAILSKLEVMIHASDDETLEFEGSAEGKTFKRLRIHGHVDRPSGTVTMAGDLDQLVISDALRDRLPPELKELAAQSGLVGGEVDLSLRSASFQNHDPKGTLRYDAGIQLRAGVWDCPKMPFPLNGVSASLSVADGKVVLDGAEGFNGTTKVRASGECSLDDPATAPMDFELIVHELALDDRLKARTPPEFANLWREFSPGGKVSAALHAVRRERGGKIGVGMTVDCEDVSMMFHLFKYPLTNIRGRMTLENDRLTLMGLHTTVGGKPLTASGTIDRPGPKGVADLTFEAQALPIDEALMTAMPPDVREVVRKFSPQGTVRGKARLRRVPPRKPGDNPVGVVTIDADVDLNENCSIRWEEFPYPVANLTGHLEIHPNHWIFTDMKGKNGLSTITGNGEVRSLGRVDGKDQLDIDLKINATEIVLDNQVRHALQPGWKKSWDKLNPSGTGDVKAEIRIIPGKPDWTRLFITPGPQAAVKLAYSRSPSPGDPGGDFKLHMADVRGQFVVTNGTVEMSGVDFNFYGTPVRFEKGRVWVEDSGKFDLNVQDLKVQKLRLDSKLQEIMPPVMAQFSRRLGDDPFTIQRGNLRLGWSGVPGTVAFCSWSDGLVVLDNNSADAGIPLRALQGQLEGVSGTYDGTGLAVKAVLNLDSVIIQKQQITRLTAPIELKDGVARAPSIRGTLLDGELLGSLEVKLDETPRYKANYEIRGASLESYARTVAGTQSYRGTVSGRIVVEGLGTDMKNIAGKAEVYVTDANLGELPNFVKLLNFLQPKLILQPKLRGRGKPTIHAAEVQVAIADGVAHMEKIHLSGSPLSLQGTGTLDMQGNLNLTLIAGLGDGWGVKLLNESLTAAGKQLLGVKVSGPIANPQRELIAFPEAIEVLKQVGQRPDKSAARR